MIKPKRLILFFKARRFKDQPGYALQTHRWHSMQPEGERGGGGGGASITTALLPPSSAIKTFAEAQTYYQIHLAGKTIDLSVQLKSGPYPLKVYFSADNAHAYTHKAKNNETPDTWDNPRHRRGPRVFDQERAKMLDRLIPTVQHPWKLLGDNGSDLYFSQQQDNGYHYLVVLTVKSSGHAELATAYPVTADVANKKRRELRSVLPAGQKKKPLHKAEAFSFINPQFIGVGRIDSIQDITAPRCSPQGYEAGAFQSTLIWSGRTVSNTRNGMDAHEPTAQPPEPDFQRVGSPQPLAGRFPDGTPKPVLEGLENPINDTNNVPRSGKKRKPLRKTLILLFKVKPCRV